MQAACDTAFKYAHERKQFGVNIGEFQLIQAKENKPFKIQTPFEKYTLEDQKTP